MKTAPLLLALCLTFLTASACVDEISLEGRPCPCATGWQCCSSQLICVADGAQCPTVADMMNHPTPHLSVLAGQLGGAGNTDGFGAEARFRGANVLLGDAGTLYVGDQTALRKLDLVTGEVRTIAGSLSSGHGDGIGADATFHAIGRLTSNHAGTIYVEDSNAIRSVDLATGAVTTLAHLDAPVTGMAWDPKGSLYVFLRAGIDRIALDSGTVSHLAAGASFGSADGVGDAAQFDYGTSGSLAYDEQGTLYVADEGTIRAVDVATATVSTPLGQAGILAETDGPFANARFGRILRLSFDRSTNALLVDEGGPWLRWVDLTHKQVTTIPLTSTTYATAIAALDGQAYLSTGSRIDRATGVALAGSQRSVGSLDGTGGLARFDLPRHIVADDAGHLFVSEFGRAIRQVELATGAVTTLVRSAEGPTEILDGPRGVARFNSPDALDFDGQGALLVVDGCTIRRIVIASGEVTTLAGATCGFFDGRGKRASFRYITALTADRIGNVFVIDQDGNALRKLVLATGEVTTLRGVAFDATQGQIPRMSALAVRGSSLFFTQGGNELARLELSTGQISTVATAIPPVSAMSIDASGHAYLINAAQPVVFRVELDSGARQNVVGRAERYGVQPGTLPASLNQPIALALTPSGQLALADFAENAMLLADLP